MSVISNRGGAYMTQLIEVPNSRLKQYYYDVIKELYNIGLSDISMTEHFILMCNILTKGCWMLGNV